MTKQIESNENKNAFQSKVYHLHNTQITKTLTIDKKINFCTVDLDFYITLTLTFKQPCFSGIQAYTGKVMGNMMFYSFDLHLDPMTLILKPNLDTVKMYLHTKNEVPSYSTATIAKAATIASFRLPLLGILRSVQGVICHPTLLASSGLGTSRHIILAIKPYHSWHFPHPSAG